jgi:hypothetical protein
MAQGREGRTHLFDRKSETAPQIKRGCRVIEA